MFESLDDTCQLITIVCLCSNRMVLLVLELLDVDTCLETRLVNGYFLFELCELFLKNVWVVVLLILDEVFALGEVALLVVLAFVVV